jgi:hypothetical protein
MEIHRDGIDGKFWVITTRVDGMILKKFDMNNVKLVKYFLAFHYKISSGLCPSNEEEKGYMSCVWYASRKIDDCDGMFKYFT